MRRKKHPLSGSIYEDLGDGRVRVTKREATGVFDSWGRWIEGDVTQADPHMLQWVGGRDLPRRGGRPAQPEAVRD